MHFTMQNKRVSEHTRLTLGLQTGHCAPRTRRKTAADPPRNWAPARGYRATQIRAETEHVDKQLGYDSDMPPSPYWLGLSSRDEEIRTRQTSRAAAVTYSCITAT